VASPFGVGKWLLSHAFCVEAPVFDVYVSANPDPPRRSASSSFAVKRKLRSPCLHVNLLVVRGFPGVASDVL